MDPTLINLVAAIGTAVAAIASVIVAVGLGLRAESNSSAQKRHSEFIAASEWRRDLNSWAAEAIDVL